MSNDQNTILVSERYNRMIQAIEAYVEAEKLSTRRHLKDKYNREKREAMEAALNAQLRMSRVERDALAMYERAFGPMIVSVTGATEEDEYKECDDDCEHCACKGEN